MLLHASFALLLASLLNTAGAVPAPANVDAAPAPRSSPLYSNQKRAVTAPFKAPSNSPLEPSPNYVGQSNSTLKNSPVVPGKAFDRFHQIWLENTDYASAASEPSFQRLAAQGILLEQFYGVTHPSEPNYLAVVAGDFWGDADDNFYAVPSNVSTIVDLLDQKNISWASYQENMPYDGFAGFNFSQPNYVSNTNKPYTYYVRKHNPLVLYDSVANVPARAERIRNFNDFAADVGNNTIPQWTFITPNLVNDAHDTTITYTSAWLDYFMPSLLNNTAFNDNRTLILLTFDETETYETNNRVYTLLLGGAIPQHLRGTTDSTFYTHYSALSSVQNNWGLGSLGRQDTNKTVSNVFSLVANATGYHNLDLTEAEYPLLNITETIPGPLNANMYVPYLAPNTSAVGAGGGPVFVGQGVDLSLNAGSAPAPVNLTAEGKQVPSAVNPATASAPGSSNNAAVAASPVRYVSAGVAAAALALAATLL